jgi:hypothetical protein
MINTNSASSAAASSVSYPVGGPEMKYPVQMNAQAGVPTLIELGSFAGYHAPTNLWKVTVDWGDGVSTIKYVPLNGGLGAQPHTYAQSGPYTVSVTVEDSNFRSATHYLTVNVAQAPTTTSVQA